MNHAPPELDIIATFRRQLAELPEPPQRVRRAPAIVAAAAFAAVPLVTVLAGTDASSQALAITRTATTLELRIADASAQPDELTRELNDAGIRGRVLVIPVAPARAGTWVVTVGRHRRGCRQARDLHPAGRDALDRRDRAARRHREHRNHPAHPDRAGARELGQLPAGCRPRGAARRAARRAELPRRGAARSVRAGTRTAPRAPARLPVARVRGAPSQPGGRVHRPHVTAR